MKKIYKRILIVFAIIAIITCFAPFLKSNAIASNKITYNGITLEYEPIISDASYGIVYLTIANESSNVYGASGIIKINGYFDNNCYINSITEGWEVTASSFSAGEQSEKSTLAFIAEAEDLTAELPETLKVKIRFGLYKSEQEQGCYIDVDKFKLSNEYSICTNPFENYDSEEFGVIFEESDLEIIEIKSGNKYSDKIKIDKENKEIYVKLDGYTDGLDKVGDIVKLLKFNTSINTIGFGVYNNESFVVDIQSNDPENFENMEQTLSNRDGMYINSDQGEYTYKLYLMGNVRKEDVLVGGAININDVMALRGMICNASTENTEVPSNCEVKCSDVNFSNDELGTLGDIGDVISIRKRILTNKWIDVVRYADVNADGAIDTGDLVILTRYLLINSDLHVELNSIQLKNADIYYDNVVNEYDLELLNWVLANNDLDEVDAIFEYLPLTYICGDVNLDKVIDNNDVEKITKYLSTDENEHIELNRVQFKHADVNNDNVVDEYDKAILSYIIEKQNFEVLPLTMTTGDVNLDGEVDLLDTVELMKYLSSDPDEHEDLNVAQLKNADINNDETVDTTDLTLLMALIAEN